MLKFDDLSNAQKKYVNAVRDAYPEVFKDGDYDTGVGLVRENGKIFVTRDFLVTFHDEMFSKRESGGVKIGYPIWLTNNNKHTRGVYVLPDPTKSNVAARHTKVAEPTAEVNESKEIVSDNLVERALAKRSRVQIAVDESTNDYTTYSEVDEDEVVRELRDFAMITIENSML
jgi:hypothetical protein